jgi:hypothetical protein
VRPVAEVVDLFPQKPPPSLAKVVRDMVERGNTDMRLVGVVCEMLPARGAFAWPPDDDPPSAA